MLHIFWGFEEELEYVFGRLRELGISKKDIMDSSGMSRTTIWRQMNNKAAMSGQLYYTMLVLIGEMDGLEGVRKCRK